MRNSQSLKHPHCRLKHKVKHKREHDWEDNFGRDITAGEHCQRKQAAKENRLDVGWNRQIVVSGLDLGRRHGYGLQLGRLTVRKLTEVAH